MSTEAGQVRVKKFFDYESEGLEACVVGLAQDPQLDMERARAFLRDDIANKLV